VAERVVIADVYYTASDETWYVLKPPSHKYYDIYIAPTYDEVKARLEHDGWGQSVIDRWDGRLVPMWSRSRPGSYEEEFLATWTEPEDSDGARASGVLSGGEG